MRHSYVPYVKISALVFGLVLFQTPPALVAQPWLGRAPDSLLHRAELQELVALQNARDAEELIARLSDPEPAVRARAAFALASVQDSMALATLLGLLSDPDADVQADAAFALGQLGPGVPAKPLLDALTRKEDPRVRRELFTALGEVGDLESLVALTQVPLRRGDAEWVALAVGRYALRDVHAPEAMSWLIPHLRSLDPAVRFYAAYYFGRSRLTEPWAAAADSVRAALDRLRPEDPAAMHLVAALGKVADPADVPRLVRWLQTGTDWRTRVNAARALAAYPVQGESRAALFLALSDSVHHVARAAATSLLDVPDWTEQEQRLAWASFRQGVTHPIRAVVLQGLARNADNSAAVWEQVRAMQPSGGRTYAPSLAAVAELPGQPALDWLTEAAAHEDARVAYAALEALAARWRRERIAEAAPAYFAAFAQGLRRRDLATAYASAPLLADSLFLPLGSVDVLAEVYRRLRSPNDVEPMTAILASLGTAATREARAVLEEALEDPHPVVRRAAADAVGLTDAPEVASGTGESAPVIDWDYLRRMGSRPVLVLETEQGAMRLVLDAEQAPVTVQTILRLAEEGRYNGVPFHRVVPNFVVQGGDFERGDGFGGPGFSISSEFTRIPYVRGALGMASAGKDTEGSQFFITHSAQPHLDGRYTAFGYVSEGLDVVDRLAEDDRILRAYGAPENR